MKKVFNNVFAVILLFMVLTTTIFASSYREQLDELERQKENNENTIKDSKDQINKIEGNIQTLVDRILELDTQIEDYEDKISQLENQLSDKEAEINTTLKELEEAEAKETKYYEQTRERIKVMYEYGDSAYLDVLIKAKNISDFFNRVEYINAVLEYDTKMLDRLDIIRNDISEKEAKLEKEKVELMGLTENCNLQKSALNDVQIAKEQEMDNLKENKEMILAEIEAKKQELEEIEKAADEIKSKMIYDGGDMYWPFKKYFRISSYFGPRVHPIYNYNSFHSGIDIPAPTGTSVLSAYKGTVALATKSNVWGNYILIDHGSGYVTMYAHNSRLLVKKGDEVKTGQVIAKAGSTGWSSGSHLHFGIRKNGKWINPLNILVK